MRMFISVASALNIAFGCGMRFSAVDACYSRHSMYRQGYLHLLTTKDGNNKCLTLAWAWCETESADTYTWFAQQCWDAGLHRYLNEHSVVFSDRQKGIDSFFERFRAYHGHCFNHIITNAKTHCKGSGTTFSDEMAWNMRNAPTKAQFERHLQVIRDICPQGAHYFDTMVDHDHAYQYRFNENKVATKGFKTSQIVECQNGVYIPARLHAPYRSNNMILADIGKEYDLRLETITKWLEQGHILTPWAHHQFQMQVFDCCLCVHDFAYRILIVSCVFAILIVEIFYI